MPTPLSSTPTMARRFSRWRPSASTRPRARPTSRCWSSASARSRGGAGTSTSTSLRRRRRSRPGDRMLFGKLLPREGNFFELFNQHAGFIAEGARAFTQLIRNYADPQLRERHANEVGTLERQADRVTAEVNRLLHKTFITPIDREQIHGLITAMDDILDLLQDASETMSLYDVQAMTADILR